VTAPCSFLWAITPVGLLCTTNGPYGVIYLMPTNSRKHGQIIPLKQVGQRHTDTRAVSCYTVHSRCMSITI